MTGKARVSWSISKIIVGKEISKTRISDYEDLSPSYPKIMNKIMTDSNKA